jgi:type I restriction enzyme M protein
MSSAPHVRKISNVLVTDPPLQQIALLLDPRARRESLERVHSALRSADRLRPDEAFDELVALYEIWVEHGPLSIEEIEHLRPKVQMSGPALRSAVPQLWAILGDRDQAAGPDLFQELVDVGVRSGLGQYFTPLPAARAMADYLAPVRGEHWLDPFCGSGLLLGEVANAAGGSVELYGTDVDHRVLRLAAVEALLRHPESPLTLANISALDSREDVLEALGAPTEGVDGIVTNPPFGAVDLRGDGVRSKFELAFKGATPIEILGLEQSIRLLRPGGRMGIVLPQSVFSNKRVEHVRLFLQERVRIDAVLSLPPDTFALFKGVGKASVLFLSNERPAATASSIWFGVPTCVGWDSTGRHVGEEDLTATAAAMRAGAAVAGKAEARTDAEVVRNLTAEWHLRHEATGVAMGELVAEIFTGKTPPRSAYCARSDEAGVYRTVKVGTLTGSGLDWSEGERTYAKFGKLPPRLILRRGDLVLTAAAHHPRYIGAKVDVVDVLPSGWEERCVPSGELMVIRPREDGIESRVLLMWLRTEAGRAAIQACVTGQTAHLHSEYVLDVVVPEEVVGVEAKHAIDLLNASLKMRRESERLAAEAVQSFRSAVLAG